MFNSGNCGASVPLVASIDGCGGNNNGMNGWGDGGWLWIIVVFALLFGWGNNGWGNNGNSNGGYGAGGAVPYVINTSAGTDSEVQRGFDQQVVVTKLDGITQGICDSTYALSNTMTNGFAGVNQALCNGFNNTNTAMMQGFNAANVTALQGFNGVERGFCNLSSQLADCCCQNREAIAQVRYDMATQACDTRNTIQNSTRDIIDNQNANYRALTDFLVQDKISSLQAENQALKFQASQANQNAVLQATMDANTAEIIRRTGNDCPIPAYVVPNPNCCYGNPIGVNYGNYGNYGNGCGCNSGCGCA